MTLQDLYKIIENRKKNMPLNSYIASLIGKGNDSIIQKVGEEATEVIIAAKNKDKKQIIRETADLIFHILVMLSQYKITLADILKELKKRNGRKTKIRQYVIRRPLSSP
jgi:phosphoribosyl-ATP pyrophosphohydrolase